MKKDSLIGRKVIFDNTNRYEHTSYETCAKRYLVLGQEYTIHQITDDGNYIFSDILAVYPPEFFTLVDEEVSVDSTRDERVVNNVMSHEYRVLTETEKQYMQEVKDLGLEFFELLRRMDDNYEYNRELEIAEQRVEEAVMWAVQHLTK